MTETQPDLILLDVMMPKLDGFEVCRRLRADAALPFIPIIMVTAKTDPKDIVAGLEAGGDEYLTKPVDQAALVARVKSMLRIKQLHDTLHGLAEERAEWNRTLERRVEEQVGQLYWLRGPLGLWRDWHRYQPGCSALRRGQGGQVLVTSRVAGALEKLIECEEVGALSLKGLLRPVPTFSVIGLRPID